jgi:hypothetical protein
VGDAARLYKVLLEVERSHWKTTTFVAALRCAASMLLGFSKAQFGGEKLPNPCREGPAADTASWRISSSANLGSHKARLSVVSSVRSAPS